MVNKNIIKIRKELDKLDNSLLHIIKKRAKLVDLVIKNKRFKKNIVDKKRIAIILANIAKKSKSKNIDPIVTNKIWKSMIKAFIDYEYRNFKKKYILLAVRW
jgi:chorismate mutase